MSSKLRIALILVFLAGVFVFCINNFKEADSFYHLAAGRLIWETKAIPHTDVFSLSASGHPWITHEWLAELIFYGVWHAGGYWTLMVFCAVLAALTYALVLRRSLLSGGNLLISLALILLIGSLTFELWIPRPQVFAYLFFAAELYFLERYRRGGGKIWLWSIPPLILVWSNMHASVVLGLAVLALYALGAWFKRRSPDSFGGPFPNEKPAPLWGILGFSALMSLVNPNGIHLWTYNFTVQQTLAVLKVEEWQPIENFFARDWGARAFALEIIFICVMFVWQFVRSRERRDITSLGLVLGVGLMPFISVRHVAWWPLAVIPSLAVVIGALSASWHHRIGNVGAGKIFLGIGIFLLALGIWRIPADYFNQDTVPVHAADFIERAGLKGHFFNFYNHGGYLIWRFWPREKVFIDGRSEVFAGEPAGEYLAVLRTQKWDELVNKKYDFNYFILPYRPENIGLYLFPLYSRLIKDGWIFVYWDDSAVVFVRPSRDNLPIAAKYAIRYVGPWTDPAAIPPAVRHAAASELQGLLDRAPYSVVIRDYTGQFLSSLGRK